MFDVLTDINWLGFAVASALAVGLAGLWFAVIIAKPYQVALGRENDSAPTPSNVVTNLGPVVCLLIVTFASAVLIEALGITTFGDAIVFGLIVGIGYLSAMTFQIAINPNFPRPLYYGVLNAPFFIATSVISAVVMTSIR